MHASWPHASNPCIASQRRQNQILAINLQEGAKKSSAPSSHGRYTISLFLQARVRGKHVFCLYGKAISLLSRANSNYLVHIVQGVLLTFAPLSWHVIVLAGECVPAWHRLLQQMYITGRHHLFSRCLLRKERGKSEAESPVDIVCTRSWEGII